MDIAAVKASLGDIEAQITSSTNKIDETIRDLNNDLRDLRICFEKRNEETNKLTSDNYELLALFKKIINLIQNNLNNKFAETLEVIDTEVKALTSVIKPEGKIAANCPDSGFSVVQNSAKNEEGIVGAEDERDDQAEALTRQAKAEVAIEVRRLTVG